MLRLVCVFGTIRTLGDASVTADSSALIQFDSTLGGDELRLVFASPLGATGDTLTTAGYESEVVAGSRTIASGSVVPAAVTPEPASFVLLGTGLLGIAGVMRRRFV